MTFRTRENFRTEYMQFEVADFEMTYNAFLGKPALTKFMAVPHYAYLVLKMPSPNGVISIKWDVKHTYDYDRESYEMADILLTSAELQELKKALVESHPYPIMPEAKTSMVFIQPKDNLSKMIPLSPNEPSLMLGAIWTRNRNSCSLNSSRKIGASSLESMLTCRKFLGN
jgi:hypothetical protein